MDYDLIPLLTLLEKYPESEVMVKLQDFHCSRDDDRESYLHNKAIPMEKKAMSEHIWQFRKNMVSSAISLSE